ncbi:phage holin family protein [Micromonospora sp. C28SCA-DRY-2]|uniref:phage holin family protein n=1 Tax=Micromonospora sp. C28SCA-DRY-2 TaxID=3059522 RepID=UPI0026753FB4|nr:phage holin family protein [Micromonospora sp. C28SCA-DRY-2]MDO3704097.1 phage holin family protein [Micromonospora sp. C28SCA-DRY-2]
MADVANARTSRNGSEPSTAELVQRATEQISRLVRDELALARAELAQKGKHAGIGIGLFGGGGALALYGLGALVATAILLLDLAMPAWLAALIVAVVLFVVAGVLALVGKKQVSRAVPPVPSATVRSVRADVDTVTAAVKDRGRG